MLPAVLRNCVQSSTLSIAAVAQAQAHHYSSHKKYNCWKPQVTRTMQVLSGQENIPTSMEPPAKQPRLLHTPSFKVKLLNEHAVPPKRGSALAAGYDLSSAEDCVVPARGKLAVHTGLAIHVPHGTYGRVAPRSGLAAKHFIDVGAGVIDEDYRGEVLVLLFNHAETDFKVNKGDRIAQLVLECIVTPDVELVEDLDDTSRGAGGFGSTGIAKQ